MLIKRVVIQGFKTFARRTEFLFDPGVTAIVGPNGSGKSNVVDAIRWCLGEQSFSLMRSKKTSDVIFSGSDKRARLGMAEVSLTLDNSTGEIPLEFAEVEITRRAYRDGENEYLINSQQVRLLDVSELLAHTGLGKRTYAVIGQGLIDQVLSYTPEERRVLFEEAAGITGHQMKRATALRRLEATQQNLTRAEDIIAELSPRLKYLRRQAERAREYNEVANELRILLRDWYGYRWHNTLQSLAQNQSLEEEIGGQVARRQSALAELNRRIESARLKQTDLRSQLGDLHRASSSTHQQVEGIDRELAVTGERLRQLQERAEETQRERAALHLEQESVSQRRSLVEAALVTAQAEYAQRAAALATLQSAVNARQQEQNRLQVALDQARRRHNESQRRHVEATSRVAQLAERQAALVRDQSAQEQLHRSAQTAGDADAVRLRNAEAEVAHCERLGQNAQQEIAALEATISEQRVRRFLGSFGSQAPQIPPMRGTPQDGPQPRMVALSLTGAAPS